MANEGRAISPGAGDGISEQRPRLLELGSGLGLVASVASRALGYDVVATDKAIALPLLRENLLQGGGGLGERGSAVAGAEVAVDAVAKGSVAVAAFDWSSPPPPAVETGKPFALVVCADCLYDSSAVGPLLQALTAVCSSSSSSDQRCTRVLLANELRTALDAFLRAAPAAGFDVQHLGIRESVGIHGKRPVGLYVLTSRRKGGGEKEEEEEGGVV